MIKYLAAILLFVITPMSSAEQIPLEQFTKHGDYLDMKISPDGKHLLARIQHAGEVNLVFLEPGSMKIVGGVRPPEGDAIHSALWVNNERVIYRLAERSVNFDQPTPTGELYAQNIDGSKQEMLYGYRAHKTSIGRGSRKREASYATVDIISPLIHDKDHILILEHPWTLKGRTYYDIREKYTVISKLNIFTGRKTEVETLSQKGAVAIANDNGDINFIRWTDSNNDNHGAYRTRRGEPWNDIKTAFHANQDLIPLAQSKDGKQIFFWGHSGNERFKNVFSIDLEKGEITQLFNGLQADIIAVNVDPLNESPVIGISMPNKYAYHYVEDNQAAKLHKMLVEAFGGQHVSISSATDDGKKLLLHVSSDVNPGEYYLYDTQKMAAEFLWANRSWLDPRKLAKMKPFSFVTDDNMQIHGYLTLPPNLKQGQKPPMVVNIHGGPHGPRDMWGFNWEVQFLANRGYAVLQVNFRGSGGYGDQFEEAGYREWGGKMIKDITDATRYVVEQGLVDGDRLCAYGASYGGYAALMTTIRKPDMFKCTIGYVGVYDLRFMYTDSDITIGKGGENYLEEVIGSDPEELAANSPVNFADKIKADVLLIHGEKDARVSVRNAAVMLDAFSRVGKRVPYLNFDKSGHGVYDEQGRVQLYSEIEKFLDKQIGNQ